MVTSVLGSVHHGIDRDELRRELTDHMVFVRTWGAEFEFAHFTESELARAILAICPGVRSFIDLRGDLRRCRAAGANIGSV